jgi:hypothetical protein
MMFWSISEGVKAIAKQMIDKPEDWRQSRYYFHNIKHPDISIWTANGTTFIKFEGNECLTLAEKAHLSKAIKKSIANRIK